MGEVPLAPGVEPHGEGGHLHPIHLHVHRLVSAPHHTKLPKPGYDEGQVRTLVIKTITLLNVCRDLDIDLEKY